MQPALEKAAATPRSRVRRYLPWIGLLFLCWLLSRYDLRAAGEAFRRVRLSSVCEALLLFAANLLLKSLRWQRMLSAQGLILPARHAIAAFFSSQFYGQVTLGRLGELYRAEVLTERGVPVGVALSSCVYDRLLDIAAVLVIAAGLSAGVVGDARAALISAALMVLMLGAALAVVRAPRLAARPFVRRLRTWLTARRGVRGVVGVLGQVVTGMGPLLRPAFSLEVLAWTCAAWLCYFGSLWLLAPGLQVFASWMTLTASAALGALSSLLPVTISGLGAREAISIYVLGFEGVEAERAFVLSLLHMSVMSATAIGLGALGMLARGRQQRASAEVERSRAS